MEVNLIAFVLLLSSEGGGAIEYFVAQRVGSSLIFRGCFLSGLLEYSIFDVLVTVGLVLKLGAFPFFQWYLEVLYYCCLLYTSPSPRDS